MNFRIDQQTKFALDMVTAKMQLQTGRTVTAAETIWRMINELYPDVADEVSASPSVQPKKRTTTKA